MNLSDSLRETEKEFSLGSNFYKFDKGDNKLRVLTMWEPLATHFVKEKGKTTGKTCYGKDKGCPYHDEGAPLDDNGNPKGPDVKFVCYVMNRSDGDKVQVAKLPYTVVKKISEFQVDEEWAFDNFPMPYDIKVTFDPDAAGAAMYSVIPSPKREEVPAEVITDVVDNKKGITRLIDEWKSKEAFGGK